MASRSLTKPSQCPHCHGWPQVGPADADVHHIGDALVPKDFIHERQHALPNVKHFWHHVLSVHCKLVPGVTAHGHVQDRTVFGRVQPNATKQILGRSDQIYLLRQCAQGGDHFVVPALLGSINQQAWEFPAEVLGPG